MRPQHTWPLPLLAILFFCAGWAGSIIRLRTGLPPVFWFAHGVVVGAFLLYGVRTWAWFAVAGVALHLSRGLPVSTSLLLTVGHLVGAASGVSLYHHFVGTPRINRLREMLLLLLFCIGIGTAAGSGVEAAAVALIPGAPFGPFWQVWFLWWMNETLGALSIVPLWTAIATDPARVRRLVGQVPWHGILILVLVSGISAMSYTPLSNVWPTLLIRPYLLYPLIIWAALRYEVLGASVVLLIAAAGLIVGVFHRTIPGVVGYTDALDPIMLQGSVLITLGVTGFAIASAVWEKDEALEVRDSFLSIASHELKTPITSLALHAHMARKSVTQLPAGAGDRAVRLLGQSEAQLQRITRLVDDMLDISRIASGKLTLRPERFDLTALLEEVLTRMAPVLQDTGSELRWRAPGPIEGSWDRIRLEQALTNLLTNAARYGAGKPVEVSAEANGGQALVRVRDQGRGIAPADQERIFQRFERVAVDVSGLGIGLFIVRQVAELHGGSVTVESELGKGSTFTLRLPLG